MAAANVIHEASSTAKDEVKASWSHVHMAGQNYGIQFRSYYRKLWLPVEVKTD